MITDKLSDAIAIGVHAKETLEEEKEKRQEQKMQEEEQKKQAQERVKQEATKKRNKTLKWAIPVVCALIAISTVMAMFEEDVPQVQAQEPPKTENTSSNQPVAATPIDGELKVSYIDVGQGDAIFIELPNGESMLIDAGNSSDSSEIINYIQGEGFGKIDYLVVTHPHDDHIGGMPQVVSTLDIKSIYMPKVSHTTNVFSNLLDAIESKGLKINTAKAGVSILNDGNLRVDILAPVGDSYSDLNDYSVVIKVVYGDNSFLFMGDAEKLSEGQITADVNADVLKVGHHGSDYSSGQSFLNLVSPSYAVISAGEGNQYGHPNSETINALLGVGSKVYRTDLDGTIVFVSDGTNVTVSKSPTTTTAVVVIPPTQQVTTPTQQVTPSIQQEPAPIQPSTSQATVYITDTGSKYHSYGCRYLKSSCSAVTLQRAKSLGLTPCSVCDPPQ